MAMKNRAVNRLLLVVLILLVAASFVAAPAARKEKQLANSFQEGNQATTEWIIKWKGSVDPSFLDTSMIEQQIEDMGVTVAKPKDADKQEEWVQQWSESPAVEYIQPNGRYKAAVSIPVPNDPLQIKQKYLQQIHVEDAWKIPTNPNAKPITIAVVDTGVDFKHPDLTGKLLQGANLLRPGTPPQDDNGHGTNVSGVITANVNNDKGIAGIAWNTKILPVKALEADGTGGEAKLGEGIRYAVNQGAKIVVLSLGLNKYSPFMSDIVNYAEEKGVLIVAASGNEGTTVKYPAAYPTVMAVGGVTSDLKPDPGSNRGPEMDIVAPWTVFTTALGGNYEYKDGTSMAAPQVAAVAALAWNKYPEFKPAQLRSLLMQTAEDLDVPGWDSKTGYGLLRADRALTLPFVEDMFEDNNTIERAKALSIHTRVNAVFSDNKDQDWFMLESPYTGTVTFQFESPSAVPVSFAYFPSKNRQGQTHTLRTKQNVTINVKKGVSYIRLMTADATVVSGMKYTFSTGFVIDPDPYEENDRQTSAYTLPSVSQEIKGTLHKTGDQDWFRFVVEKSGTLRVKVSTDTARMDPVLTIQPKNGKSLTIDQGGDGAPESSQLINILPGEYFIRVSNVTGYPNAITGEYTLGLEYKMKYIDPNEPNNKSYQATELGPHTTYKGTFDTKKDEDWYSITLDRESLLELHFSDLDGQHITLNFTDRELNVLETASSVNGTWDWRKQLKPGQYYLQLQSEQPFELQMYQMKVDLNALYGGYVDIADHWAADAILLAKSKGYIKDDGSLYFKPDESLSKAEAVLILTKAFRMKKEKPIMFVDVPRGHWALDAIALGAHAGIVKESADHKFDPDKPVTRMEMVELMAGCLKYTGKLRGGPPFTDTAADFKGVGLLKQFKAEGWIKGLPDGSFHPLQEVTRAEFISLLSKIPTERK